MDSFKLVLALGAMAMMYATALSWVLEAITR